MQQQQLRLKQQQSMIEHILRGNCHLDLVQVHNAVCKYVGNIHPHVTEPLLQEVFASIGPLEGCKLIRQDKDAQSATNDLNDNVSRSPPSFPCTWAGVIEDVRIQRNKEFGFKKYSSHARAIPRGNGRILFGKTIKRDVAKEALFCTNSLTTHNNHKLICKLSLHPFLLLTRAVDFNFNPIYQSKFGITSCVVGSVGGPTD